MEVFIIKNTAKGTITSLALDRIEKVSQDADLTEITTRLDDNEIYVHNAYVETDYLANQFDISDKLVSVPNLPKSYISTVVLRNSDDLDKPNRFTAKVQGDNAVSIKFENLSEQPMYPQTLHIGVKMLKDKNWNVNTGDLQKVFVVGSNDSNGLIYSTDNLATFKTLNIPGTSLPDIGEIAHDVERREIYLIGGYGQDLATNNFVIGKLVGLRLDSSDDLVYDSYVEVIHGDDIRVVSDVKSYKEHLYIIEQFPVSRTNTKIHRLLKSDLSIVNSVDVDNKYNLDVMINDNGIYTATGVSTFNLDLIRFDLDLSNKSTTILSGMTARSPLLTRLGDIIYVVAFNTLFQDRLYIYEYDTKTNTTLRSSVDSLFITDYGDVGLFSLETDGVKLYINSYDIATIPNNNRMVIINISDFSLVSETATSFLGEDSIYDFKNERVVFTGYDGTDKGSILTYDKATQTETVIPINSESLSALDYFFIPKIN